MEKVDSSGTTRYVYDGSTIIADTNSSGTIQNYYLPGVGFTTAAGVQRYYRENALGSNLATTNSAGTVDSRTEYDGYGVEYNVLAGTKSAFKFAGKHGYVTDDQSGLDMLGVRYYAPTLGRFLTQDPKGHDAGLNLYEYCVDNPLGATDPSGLDPGYWEQVLGVFKGYGHAIVGLHRLGRSRKPWGIGRATIGPLTMESKWPRGRGQTSGVASPGREERKDLEIRSATFLLSRAQQDRVSPKAAHSARSHGLLIGMSPRCWKAVIFVRGLGFRKVEAIGLIT